MKKLNKLTAAVGVALSLGIASQADAVIELKHGGKGDVVLFPYYNGSEGWENYYTIINDSALWIQGHLRFRGATWCGELRDFDIILSPGDVFVFRIADVDGDGEWELDQSLDERNFQYVGLHEADDQGDMGLSTSHCTSSTTGEVFWHCLDPSYQLIPAADNITTEDKIKLQEEQGQIEFIGEAVLDNMDKAMMNTLLGPNVGLWEPYQTKLFSKRGTSAWKWSNAEGQRLSNQFDVVAPSPLDQVWVGNRGLSDVPNVLSGVAFISQTGTEGTGMAYNAEVLVNFRTPTTDHRIDNYRIDVFGNSIDTGNPTIVNNNRAVIVHDENGASTPWGTSPRGDYVYFYREEDNIGGLPYEGRISFNNTWGPTLADGDDYNLTRGAVLPVGNVYGTTAVDSLDGLTKPVNLRWTIGTGNLRFADNLGNPGDDEFDDFDVRVDVGLINSIAEVEEAIRVGGQHFSGFYFDGATPSSSGSLTTWFLAWFPTKFFYGERSDYYQTTSLQDYIISAVHELVSMPKTFKPEVWDINENTAGTFTTRGECISPAIGPECMTTTKGTGFLNLAECCSNFSILDVKRAFSEDTTIYTTGRVVFASQNNDPVIDGADQFRQRYSWPVIIYSYEMGGISGLAHWRMLNR